MSGVKGTQLPHLHSEAAKAEGQPSDVGRLHGGEQAGVNPHTLCLNSLKYSESMTGLCSPILILKFIKIMQE